MSHKILLLLALVGPILLIAAGGVAHVWGRRRKRLAPADQEPENSKSGDLAELGITEQHARSLRGARCVLTL